MRLPMVVMKMLLHVDDFKITACVIQICPLDVTVYNYVRFQIEKHWLVKHFAFLKNISYQYLNFVLRVTYIFFNELLIGSQQTFLVQSIVNFL